MNKKMLQKLLDNDNVVINIVNYFDLDIFTKWLKENNIKWSDGYTFRIDNSNWYEYEDDTCYRVNKYSVSKYATTEYYLNEGCQVLNSSECFDTLSQNYSIEDFRFGKFGINITSKKDVGILEKILNQHDIKWKGDRRFTIDNCGWDIYNKNTCYKVYCHKICFGLKADFEKINFPIISIDKLQLSN